jgi:hypothetical protein
MARVGAWVGRIEDVLGAVWSVSEVGLALTRVHEIWSDPHRDALHADVAARGFYPPIDVASLDFEISHRGVIRGTNPYQRIAGGPQDAVLAHLHRAARNPSRHLVVVCHCYGVPSARIMRRLFGLDGLDVDVVTNVMAHHQPGTYPVWPGSGLASARLSRFVENLRSAVTGVRALSRWLRAREGYATVSALGFSIGGQLVLHLAHAGELDRALLYCPVISVRVTLRELGLMRYMAPTIESLFARMHGGGLDDVLRLADPLALPLPIPADRMHVVLQRHDALSPPHQIEEIRRKYPAVGWTELNGTHLLPLGLSELHRAVRRLLSLPVDQPPTSRPLR